MLNTTVDVAKAPSKKKKSGPWREVWRRLKHNKAAITGLVVLLILIFVAVFADFIAPYGPDDQDLQATFQKPNRTHIMGTDNLGRDIFSRIIYGAQVSLQVGLLAVGIALIIGSILGSIAGFYGGVVDNIIMRFIDILLAIPPILLAISIVAALGTELKYVMIAVGIGSIPSYARIIRASVLSLRDQEFIEAARAVGANDFRLITKHIIPNSMAPLIVQATIGVAGAILAAAGLGFIGLGIQPPQPEWGAMLNNGRHYIRDYPHMTAFPGLAIMITIFALNLLGDGLRDALDPRLKN